MATRIDLAWSQTLPYKIACDLPDCGRPVNRVVFTTLGKNTQAHFCSGEHSRIGIARFNEKIAKGIKPGAPVIKHEPDAIGDNTAEIGGMDE